MLLYIFTEKITSFLARGSELLVYLLLGILVIGMFYKISTTISEKFIKKMIHIYEKIIICIVILIFFGGALIFSYSLACLIYAIIMLVMWSGMNIEIPLITGVVFLLAVSILLQETRRDTKMKEAFKTVFVTLPLISIFIGPAILGIVVFALAYAIPFKNYIKKK